MLSSCCLFQLLSEVKDLSLLFVYQRLNFIHHFLLIFPHLRLKECRKRCQVIKDHLLCILLISHVFLRMLVPESVFALPLSFFSKLFSQTLPTREFNENSMSNSLLLRYLKSTLNVFPALSCPIHLYM